MVIAAGSRVGPYEIVAPLGAGGMGEVWRARDTRLERSVAIKVLPPGFAEDAQLKLRFEREAKTISQLNHPHICTLHDIGSDSGVDYLVMELLEGESLADRLAKGPLPIEQVLRYGSQIAEALDKAHRAGVVHRDLKPGNIMLTKVGAKLLDFGLAKPSGGFAGQSSPGALSGATEARPLTQEGTIVGTFQYMAPEQIEGVEADARTDIFALGCVLYEAATGRRAFDGKTRTSIIAAIVDRDPKPISELQPLTPRSFEHVVAKCLEKDPNARWQSAYDIAEELRWISTAEPVSSQHRSRAARLPWILAALLALGAIAEFAYFRRAVVPPRVLRYDIVPPPHVRLLRLSERGGGSISPDGNRIVFVGADASGVTRLYVRELAETDARALPDTEGAALPFWSPDSRSIAFFAKGKLERIGIEGARAAVILDNVDGRGGAWSADGTILLSPSSTAGLVRVAATGGEAAPLTHLTGDQTSHRFPCFLSDGKHFLYFAQGSRDRGIYVASLDGRLNRKLIDSSASGVVAEPATLIFERGEGVFAQRIDTSAWKLVGSPVEIAPSPAGSGGFGLSGLSASRAGSIAAAAGMSENIALVVRDRTGKLIRSVGGENEIAEPTLAPDGKRIAGSVGGVAGARELWEFDLERGRATRLTFGQSGEPSSALWSPDGSRIFYAAGSSGKSVIAAHSADGSSSETIATLDTPLYPESFSTDGKLLTMSGPGASGIFSISALSLPGPVPHELLKSPFNQTKSHLSPDGKLIAYTSDESGRPEVYVQTFPPSGRKWQISSAGGDQANWRGDGREIFYLQPDGKLMAVAVQLSPAASFGDPAVLFQTQVVPVSITGNRNQFVVFPDGQQFLILEPVADALSRFSVVVNWQLLLDKRE